MKKLFFLLLFIYPLMGFCTDVRITVRNLTNVNLVYKAHTGDINQAHIQPDFDSKVYTGAILKPGETFYFRTSFYFLTGVEGSVILGTSDNTYQFVVNFNNPFIGASEYSQVAEGPYKWRVVALNKNYSYGEQFYELELMTIDPPLPKTTIPSLGNGTIKGSVRWLNDVGSPVVSVKQDAFKVISHAPQYFQPITGTNPLYSNYNGQTGIFEGQQNVGNVQWDLESIDNYTQLNYTVTGVPLNVPITFDISCRDNIKWTAGSGKPSPGTDYTYIVGTYPVSNNFLNTINNEQTIFSGVDFECSGDWMQLNTDGSIKAGNDMSKKIADRKNAPVLPGGGMLVAAKADLNSRQTILNPAVQNKNQNVEVQKVRTSGAVRIRQ